MKILELLKKPLFNAVFGGILMYFVITISNKGDPIFGALLSSFPIGILGLLAITKDKRELFIKSAVFVNLIIFIMWSIIWFVYTNKNKHLYTVSIIGFLTWLILGTAYYISSKYMKLI